MHPVSARSQQLFELLEETEQCVAAHSQRTDAHALHSPAYAGHALRERIFLPRKGEDLVLFPGRISVQHALMGEILSLTQPGIAASAGLHERMLSKDRSAHIIPSP